MNTGLFGGTFNPLHNGHIDVISHVKEKFALDIIHVIPCATPPHKKDTNLVSAEIRFEMVKKSIKNIKGLIPSDVEIKRKGKSYTIDTINQFKRESDPGTNFFFIMGSDAFFDIKTWKKNLDIFRRIAIIVMIRAGEKRKLNSIESFIQNMVSNKYLYNRHGRSMVTASVTTKNESHLIPNSWKDFHIQERSNSFFHPWMKPVHICNVPAINISSTKIRNLVKKNLSTKSMIPDSVEKIIRKKGLYL
ncbi:MAG: nicotinate-nucleotide adenylyltransferase [Thermodesulfobacteriota bacterium]|nr:nicotinate-nucleotide adenylyltransferase [Thermodesulfobacteriota bacterium]